MRVVYTIVMIMITISGFSQVEISGIVTDANGAPISGANIFLMDTYDGASSLSDGSYEFTTNENGSRMLVSKFIGYKDFQHEINLEGKDVNVNVIMEETINELDAVMITAGSFTASDASRRTVFKPLDIATTAGATADIAAALNTLPGTQKVGEQGRLFVRGGDGNETRTFIDGMMVLDAYNVSAPNTPSRGRFLPFMFKGTSFSTGGYSAEYGQALSSALVLDSKDEAESSRTDIGILSVGADVAHTQAWKGGSVAGKIQYTNIKPYYGLINQEIDWKEPPVTTEAVAVYRQQVGKEGLLKLYGNFNRAHFSMYNHNIDDYTQKYIYDLINEYAYLNASYRTSINDQWAVRGGASYNFTQNNTVVDVEKFDEIEKALHAKVVLDGSLSEKVELNTGVELIQRTYRENDSSSLPSIHSPGFEETVVAAFTEVDLYASNKFVARPGIRAEYNSLTGEVSLDPRLSLAYKTGTSSQVSLAYGTFRQSPQSKWLKQNSLLHPEKAEHFILNYQYVANSRTFRVETYYKRYNDLIKFVDGDPAYINQQGKGYAQGIELFWRDHRSIKNVDYWVSYSYLNTERDYLDFPYAITPSFASAHNFSLVYKHFIQAIKSQLGFTFSYASGRPYNDPNTEKFNGSKTPYYSDLSINVAYLPKPFLIVYLSCTNVMGRDNIFGYEFSGNRDVNGIYQSRPVRQPAPRFLFLGIFITISRDKSVNQLPSL